MKMLIKYDFQIAYVFADQGFVWLCSLVGKTLTLHLKKQLQKESHPSRFNDCVFIKYHLFFPIEVLLLSGSDVFIL